MLMRPRGINLALVTVLMGGVSLSAMPVKAQDCEVNIGVTGTQSGGGAGWGLAEKTGTEFEAAWQNAHGGLQVGDKKCHVTVFSYDTLGTAAGAAAASNFFASKGVHAVIGPIVSPATTGFKPVAARNDQVNFSSAYSHDAIGPKFPLAFHKNPAALVWGPIVVKAAVKQFNLKSVVVVGPNDQGGTDTGTIEAKLYTKFGAPATTEWYQRGSMNFAPIVTRIMGKNPTSVEMGPTPPAEAGALAKQLLVAGYDGVFGRLGTGADTIVQSAGGPEAIKSMYSVVSVPTQDPGIKKLNEDYKKLMKKPLPQDSLFYNAQIATEQVLHAISLAGGDQSGKKIAEALRKMTPESRYLGKIGWRGKTDYGINQDLAIPIGMNIIDNGKPQPQKRLNIPSEQP